MAFNSKIKTIEWVDNVSRMIDQTILPKEFKLVDIKTCEEMYDAIKTMIVRGAPAIGIAGAHGVALAAIEAKKSVKNREDFETSLTKVIGKKNVVKAKNTKVDINEDEYFDPNEMFT